MAKKLYGTDPDQVPTNADLGTMAYQDKDNVSVGEVHSDNLTVVSTKSSNALSITTNASSNVALSIGGSSTINGVTSGPQSFYIMNVARDSGSGKSTYFNGNIGFPNGYGIDFSASQGSGASSSVLDDYETGTWTPVMTGSTGSAGSASTTVYGARYTKVGNLVTVMCYIRWSDIGSYSGNAAISGLPFTSANDGVRVAGNINFLKRVELVDAFNYCGNIVANTSVVQINRIASDLAVKAQAQVSAFNDNLNEIIFSCSYNSA